MSTVKAVANIKKNRLYLTVGDRLTKREMEKLYTETRFSVADLKPGFDVISDLSKCELGHLSGVPTLKKIMAYLVANEVGTVVRVARPSSVVYRQVMNLAARVQGYKPIYVSTLEEAEEMLEKTARRNGLRINLHQIQVEYVMDEIEGQGQIVDISTSGCSVASATLQASTGIEVIIKIKFKTDNDLQEVLTINARVVRAEDDTFAVEFIDLEETRKEQLKKWIVSESQREIVDE